MANYKGPQENWNEFQWEHEIRRDERRISCYFRELPGCLDLPGEEDMIFNSLLSRPDLVPTGNSPDSLRSWQPPEEEDVFEEEAANRPGNEVIEQLDKLSVEWNAVIATKLRADLDLRGLGVACAYGKLLARVADFVDTDEQEECALKISLGKRALADLNDLARELNDLTEKQRSLAEELKLEIELLSHIRERLIDLLSLLRRA